MGSTSQAADLVIDQLVHRMLAKSGLRHTSQKYSLFSPATQKLKVKNKIHSKSRLLIQILVYACTCPHSPPCCLGCYNGDVAIESKK